MLQASTPSATTVLPTMIGGEIPRIDVSGFLAGTPGAAELAAAQLRFAFENVGFYYLAGHGVPQSLIDTAYAEAARFHALPIDRKLALKVDEHNIGYMPIARKPLPSTVVKKRKYAVYRFRVESQKARFWESNAPLVKTGRSPSFVQWMPSADLKAFNPCLPVPPTAL